MVGTKRHLAWLCERLGPLAYANPSLLLAKGDELSKERLQASLSSCTEEVRTSDFMRVLCPKCKYELNTRL